MGFDKLDQSSVRIFYVCEMSRCFTHVEYLSVWTAVHSERMAFAGAELSQFLHIRHIEADPDETGITPVSSFVNLSWSALQSLYKLDCRVSKKIGKSSFALRGGEDHAPVFLISFRNYVGLAEWACCITLYDCVAQDFAVESD